MRAYKLGYKCIAWYSAQKENRWFVFDWSQEQLHKAKLIKIKNKVFKEGEWSRNSISLEMLMQYADRLYGPELRLVLVSAQGWELSRIEQALFLHLWWLPGVEHEVIKTNKWADHIQINYFIAPEKEDQEMRYICAQQLW